ncbi:hypothetical protein PUN28_001459 [Cardiocondyla obscurior]|uniref:Uncharacterized protein n=1 Tax=Cardiocondyla obscurior TaxID=286306 RepID=A0AAW2H535_9HYME
MRLVQDADCSGRMLATILVAWVTTAMIASILLQWEHMWIVLVILTLLFFLVCGYTVYTVKRTHARILLEQQRAAIRTISGIANSRRQEPLAFAVRSPPDLPPSYASVVTVPGSSAPVRASETGGSSGDNKFEDPPPYSIVISSIREQEQNAGISSERCVPPAVSAKRNDIVITVSPDLASASHT